MESERATKPTVRQAFVVYGKPKEIQYIRRGKAQIIGYDKEKQKVIYGKKPPVGVVVGYGPSNIGWSMLNKNPDPCGKPDKWNRDQALFRAAGRATKYLLDFYPDGDFLMTDRRGMPVLVPHEAKKVMLGIRERLIRKPF